MNVHSFPSKYGSSVPQGKDSSSSVGATLEAAFRFGQPEIWNSDHGSQFTAADFLAPREQTRHFDQRGWPRRNSVTNSTHYAGPILEDCLDRATGGFQAPVVVGLDGVCHHVVFSAPHNATLGGKYLVLATNPAMLGALESSGNRERVRQHCVADLHLRETRAPRYLVISEAVRLAARGASAKSLKNQAATR